MVAQHGGLTMLVLTRTLEDCDIRIGDSIVVRLVAIEGDRCKLGIEADRSIPIRRAELPPRDVGSEG